MGSREKLERLYKTFNSYIYKSNKMGLHKVDVEALYKLIVDIAKCEVIIVDEFFDDLILADIMDDDCIEWASEINMLTGWNLGDTDNVQIKEIKDYADVMSKLKTLQYRLNVSLIKNIKKIEEYGYLEDLLSLLNKYVDGKNNLEICQKYLNNRFFDIYKMMEEKNEKIKKKC